MKLKALSCIPIFFIVGCNNHHAPASSAKVASQQQGGGSNALTYEGRIKTIILAHCMPCHAPGTAQPNWTDYDTAFAKKDKIYEHVYVTRDMPQGSTTITDLERKTIADWVTAGAPRGAVDSTIPPAVAPTPPVVSVPQLPPPYTGISALVQTCKSCHVQADGSTSRPAVPHIAGQSATYLETELSAFRSRTRMGSESKTMWGMIPRTMDDSTIHLLAQYFSQQEWSPADSGEQKALILAGKKIFENGKGDSVPACLSCHGNNAEGIEGNGPRLAGQNLEYVLNQFKNFRLNDRQEAVAMPDIVKSLSDDDLRALASYIASKK